MEMVKLITETSLNVELTESRDGKNLFVVGIFSSAELENNNNRKYRKETLNREVETIKEKVEKRCLWGELGHPPNPEINPDKIAIITEKLEWRGNDLYGRSKILDTPMGNIAKTLVREGNLGISSRGLGTVAEDGYVNEDYKLLTWDLVTDPSNNPSWVNGIYEGKEFELPGQKKVEEEEQGPTLEDAKKAHEKQIWQVIDEIDKNWKFQSRKEG